MDTTMGYAVIKSTDPEDANYPWIVLDPNGNPDDQFETKAEAVRHCCGRIAEAEEEATEVRLAALRDEVAELAAGCEDEDLLGRVRAMLGGAVFGARIPHPSISKG